MLFVVCCLLFVLCFFVSLVLSIVGRIINLRLEFVRHLPFDYNSHDVIDFRLFRFMFMNERDEFENSFDGTESLESCAVLLLVLTVDCYMGSIGIAWLIEKRQQLRHRTIIEKVKRNPVRHF